MQAGFGKYSIAVVDEGVTRAYQPIIRGYFIVAACYYAIMSVVHWIELSGASLVQMCTASGMGSLVAAAAAWGLRDRVSITKLELVTLAVNMMVLTNVLVALSVEYHSAKLVYFDMIAMIFAFASATTRQALLSIAAALTGLAWNVSQHAPDQLPIYLFIGFAAGLSAVGITFFLRRAIRLSYDERQRAETAKKDAEDRLSAAQRLGEAMRMRSLSDTLTRLPNRRAFFEAIDMMRRAHDEELWLLGMDLDGFKAVNDHHGHILGDELLKSVATRIRNCCDGVGHVSRMGGDEFSMVIGDLPDGMCITDWARQLLEVVAEPYTIADRQVRISASLGCYRISGDTPTSKLMQNADFALLKAKREGKNRCVLFTEDLARESAERSEIENALRGADLGRELELVYQPQVDIASGKFTQAEVLARWNNPDIGAISPDVFVKVAEDTGMIARITVEVVKKAAMAIRQSGIDFPLSINLSGSDLISDQIIDEVIEVLSTNKINPSQIEFEVTETAMMSDIGMASQNLRKLSALGHSIALDDFGTGYSNFNYLRTLPIDKLKIDRCFLEDMGDPMTEKILRSLVGIAKTLGVPCLLEGVESEVEVLIAKRVGASLGQGYHYGKPMQLEMLRQLLAADPEIGEREVA